MKLLLSKLENEMCVKDGFYLWPVRQVVVEQRGQGENERADFARELRLVEKRGNREGLVHRRD